MPDPTGTPATSPQTAAACCHVWAELLLDFHVAAREHAEASGHGALPKGTAHRVHRPGPAWYPS